MAVENVGMDVHVTSGDSMKTRSRDIRAAHFVMDNERRTRLVDAGHKAERHAGTVCLKKKRSTRMDTSDSVTSVFNPISASWLFVMILMPFLSARLKQEFWCSSHVKHRADAESSGRRKMIST